MVKKLCCGLLSVCLAAIAFAQKTAVTYSGNVAVGLLAGANKNALQLQVVNGVKYKTWQAGLGAGLDDYNTRSVPLFLQVRKAVTAKAATPYVYVDAGYHLPYLKDTEKFLTEVEKGGFYGEGGIGYEVAALKKHGFFFGLGWRVKMYTLKVNTMPYLSVWPPPENAFRDYDYTLTAVTLKTGFRF